MDALQIIAEPKRREILRLIWTGERTAGAIADNFDVTFGAVSQHLGVLRNAGYVRVRIEGNHRYYRADHEGLGILKDTLEAMWGETLERLAGAVEGEV